MEDAPRATVKTNTRWAHIATAVFVAVVLGIAVLALPSGFDTDLTKIGAGKPALVFVYDPNLMISNQQTREMDRLRESQGESLHFLIADVGRPDAQQFMQRYQATRTQLLLFAPDGRVVARMQGLVTAEELQRSIEAAASR